MATRTTRKGAGIILILALLMGSALGLGGGHGTAYAADGDLDPSFDGDGKVTTHFVGEAVTNGVDVQADGKIVVAGWAFITSTYDFALARYNPDGSLDSSFGVGGRVTTGFFSGDDGAYDVAIQPDGKIVAAGTAYTNPGYSDFALARYNPDGSLDSSFGVGGKVTTYFSGSSDYAENVTIQPDGKIVAAGSAYAVFMGGNNWDFALARYNPNGSLDSSFGAGGMVTTHFGNLDIAHAVAVQPDGKIVAVGEAGNGGPYIDFALARYNPNGSLDTSFGVGGKVTTDFGSSNDHAYGVGIQTDGKIVAAGNAFVGGVDFALARYNPNGSLDTSFGVGGKVTTGFGGSGYDYVRGVAIQPDGKIVAAGFSAAVDSDFALARYNPDGSLDTSFGVGGKVTTDFGSPEDYAHSVAIQPDGKIVAAGSSSITGSSGFALARYQSSVAPTPTPTSTPTCVPGGGGGGGLLVGSGIAIGYQPNGYMQLAHNIVNYTFANSQILRPNDYAIFQMYDPWGGMVIKDAIMLSGRSYDEYPPGALQWVNLNQYRVVILNWDNHFTSDFMFAYQAAIPALQAYVSGGGVLWVQAAVQGYIGETFPMPFGGTGTLWSYGTNDVVDNGNPMVVGVQDPFFGNYASYAEYTALPAGADTVVVGGGSGQGAPTLYEYRPNGGTACPTGTPTRTNTPTVTPTRTSTSTPTPLPMVVINELDSDQPGTFDREEFVELYDGGVGYTSLDGRVVVFYNGTGDVSYAAFDLQGYVTDSAGYFTLGNRYIPGVDLIFPHNFLQNGADAVALYYGDASQFPNGTPLTTANLLDAVVYGTSDPDDPGLLALLNPGQPQVDENALGTGTTDSIGRCPDGSGGTRNTSTYLQLYPSPDGPNYCP